VQTAKQIRVPPENVPKIETRDRKVDWIAASLPLSSACYRRRLLPRFSND